MGNQVSVNLFHSFILSFLKDREAAFLNYIYVSNYVPCQKEVLE